MQATARITGILFVGSNNKVSFDPELGLAIPAIEENLKNLKDYEFLGRLGLQQSFIHRIDRVQIIKVNKEAKSDYTLSTLETHLALNGFYLKAAEAGSNKTYYYFWQRVR